MSRSPESIARHLRSILDSRIGETVEDPFLDDIIMRLIIGLERNGRDAAPCLFDPAKPGRRRSVTPIEHVRRRSEARKALADAEAELGPCRPKLDYEALAGERLGIAPSTVRKWARTK